MAKTRAELIDRVARKLGKLALGQTATGDMESDIGDAYDQMYADLDNANLITFASTSIPDEFVEPIVSLVAFTRAEGIPAERYNRIALSASTARQKVADLINGIRTDSRTYKDY